LFHHKKQAPPSQERGKKVRANSPPVFRKVARKRTGRKRPVAGIFDTHPRVTRAKKKTNSAGFSEKNR